MSELRSRSSGSVTNSSADTTPSRATEFPVLDLDDARAQEPEVAGAKASALSRARVAKLPALPGFVVTTEGVRALVARDKSGAAMFAVHDKWRELSENGERSLVVRSSSPNEDGASQSMAGMFTSVLDVRGWPAFLDAVDAVARSGQGAPIAALVQPFLQPAWGGVLFGADPVTGRSDRLVVAAVPGGPDRLVSGEVDGAQLALSPRGRLPRGERGHTRRAAKPEGAPTAGSACRPRSCDLRRPAGHRVGHRSERLGGAASESADHSARRRSSGSGPRVRPGPGRRDVWSSAAPARRGPLGGAPPRRVARGTDARGRHSGPTAPRLADRRHGRWARRSRSGPPRAHARVGVPCSGSSTPALRPAG